MRGFVDVARLALLATFVAATHPGLAEDSTMETWLVQEASAPGGAVGLDLKSESDAEGVLGLLHIGCAAGQTIMMLSFNRTLQTMGSHASALVTHSFDDAPAELMYLHMKDFRSMELRDAETFQILREMAISRKWLVVTADKHHTLISVTFNVSGLDQHLPKVQKACRWR